MQSVATCFGARLHLKQGSNGIRLFPYALGIGVGRADGPREAVFAKLLNALVHGGLCFHKGKTVGLRRRRRSRPLQL